jgi:two-component system, chemotaxis family, protein-glutamate methylesterase/glutaminase
MHATDTSVIVIGGSAGALDALSVILPMVPAELPAPISIVLHILPSRPSGLAPLLQATCALTVKEAEDKEPMLPGTIYLASPNYHLLLERQGHFSLSVDEAVRFSRPSIDVLFESAAYAYGPALAGVLLSGANDDGAYGLECIRSHGGRTAVQAPGTALARTMPEAALARGVDAVLPPPEIWPWLASLVSARGGALSAQAKESR